MKVRTTPNETAEALLRLGVAVEAQNSSADAHTDLRLPCPAAEDDSMPCPALGTAGQQGLVPPQQQEETNVSNNQADTALHAQTTRTAEEESTTSSAPVGNPAAAAAAASDPSLLVRTNADAPMLTAHGSLHTLTQKRGWR